ncbi:ninjurin-2-like [Panonychus citri]|uniref:ninjurin-2-like n=1 Tax=Panonychus citri TaxID=50023 RepID=UPI0023081E90|nr:ninjurin-2-like [Panonychus citri]
MVKSSLKMTATTENNEMEQLKTDVKEPNRSELTGNLDINIYATKKTIAQGMLDVALLTANASQLKYILQLGHQHEFYFLMVTLISTSLILQITVGSLILARSRYDLNKVEDHARANVLNNSIVWLVFGITVINVFIAAFGIDPGFDSRKVIRLQASTSSAITNQTDKSNPELIEH